MYTVRNYQPSDYNAWNKFVATAKNATFLFHRNFMEYHKDRFHDFSLMVFTAEKLVALVPANKNTDKVYSHQGLTYGGVLLQKNTGVSKAEAIFEVIVSYLKENRIKTITLKTLPFVYHNNIASYLEPLLFKKKATIVKRDQGFFIDFRLPLSIHKTKRKHFNKGHNYNFTITKDSNFDDFWLDVLQPRLQLKHKASPVHSLKEIKLLAEMFPENIIQYCIYKNNELLAGITIFKTDNVVKSQYGATTQQGENFRALDYLFIYLIHQYKELNYTFFDLGVISNNYSLLKQKEELGGSQYIQDTYELNLI